ncbi:related to gyp1-gtpase activating protein [Ceraceosorus bombacis]|uniref:Related to gyp1-gtpase activating protein n=1 Tax=Ceraceosorus bombacis TaxID=401625 RepID=A0A0P1B896_9BASI|nr:related to gyp1-gtpase activating protein [Ceraceosorus bombacis]
MGAQPSSVGSWTVVDPSRVERSSPVDEAEARSSRTGSTNGLDSRSSSHSPIDRTGDRSLAGSPPTDVGSSAAAAIHSAATANGTVSRGQDLSPERARHRRDSEASSSGAGGTHAHGRGKRANAKEREEMQKCLRGDVENVTTDPTALLAGLSLDWAKHPPLSFATQPSTARPANFAAASSATLPETALAGPSFASAALSPAAGASGKRQQVDVVSMGGDGLFASGGFGASQTDLPSAEEDAQADAALSEEKQSLARANSHRTIRRRERFVRCLASETVSMDELRALAWQGVPEELRPMVWQLLLGYLPPAKAHRASVLARKRSEYAQGTKLAFQRGTQGLDTAIWHQIRIDVPRTNPGISLWQREATQRALERILYVWAIRHPASGYVQGINDLATPFFEVFLSAYISGDPESYDVSMLPEAALEALEADTFWCLSKLLDGIQDNYIFAQPGIQRQVRRMAALVARIDPPLHAHLEEQGVEYMQFAFRWMNCLLMREMSVRNIVRMWDTYLAEGPDAFSEFHLYVCSVFLSKWSSELLKMDFQGIIMFLQSLPTGDWSDRDAEMLLSDAFVKKSLFGGTGHLVK